MRERIPSLSKANFSSADSRTSVRPNWRTRSARDPLFCVAAKASSQNESARARRGSSIILYVK